MVTVSNFGFSLQSRTFHENGRRHQQAVENRLYEIKRKGGKDERKASLQDKWLQEMEHKAMNDYRQVFTETPHSLLVAILNTKISRVRKILVFGTVRLVGITPTAQFYPIPWPPIMIFPEKMNFV